MSRFWRTRGSFAVLFLFYTVILFAQAPDTLWTRKYNFSDWGYEAHRTSDGGYVVFCDAYVPPAYDLDMLIIKTNANGDTLWTRLFGGDANELGSSGQETSDGGYIALGITNSFGLGESDFYLVKTNVAGGTLWTRTYGTTGDEWACRVKQAADGGYILVGRTFTPGYSYDAYVVRTNANGDTLWTRKFGLPTEYERFVSVVQSDDGGFLCFGYHNNTATYYYNYLMVKYDTSGTVMWTRSIGLPAGVPATDLYGHDLAKTTDGGYVLVGETASEDKIYLVKTNTQGDTLWTRLIGPETERVGGYYVQQTIDGGYVIAGHKGFDAWIVKTNEVGDTIWTAEYGVGSNWYEYDWVSSIEQTSDGGYIAAGKCDNGVYGADAYLIRLAPPVVVVQPSYIGVALQPNQTAQRVFNIQNNGDVALDWTITENPPAEWLSVNPTAGTILPDSSVDVAVNIQSTGLGIGDFYDTLSISSNTPGVPTTRVTVHLSVQCENPISIFVYSTSRLSRFYPDSVEILEQKIAEFCAHTDVQGALLDVDSSQNVLDAYADWDAGDNWTRPSKANAVATAIDNHLELALITLTSVEYIVLIGEDRQIPYYRLADPLQPKDSVGWECKYAYLNGETLPIAAAIDSNQILTDDIYADTDDIPPYVPWERVVSRLVEKPGHIIAQLNRFQLCGNIITPSRILITGGDQKDSVEYKFCLQDAADSVASVYQNSIPSAIIDSDLIQRHPTEPDYDKEDLKQHFLQYQNEITCFNNHARHRYLATPTYGSEVDSYDDVMLSTSQMLAGELVYSLGCHHGLNVGGVIYDYPEAFAYKEVGAFVGNTGYGICALNVLLWSEELMLRLTRSLVSGVNIGRALRDAKHAYWNESKYKSEIDRKVIMVPILYGLPYYDVATDLIRTSYEQWNYLPAETRGRSDTLIVAIEDFVQRVTQDSTATWYTFTGAEPAALPDAPVLSKMVLTYINPDPILENLELIGCTYHHEQPSLPPALAIWRTSDAMSTGIFVCDSFYPAPIWGLNTMEILDSVVQNLIIVPMQYYQPTNTWRLYDTLVFEISTGVERGSGIEPLRNMCFVAPNPFRGNTLIEYYLTKSGEVSLVIYNVIGQRVATLISERRDAGEYKFTWYGLDSQGRKLPPGVYFMRFQAGDDFVTDKLLLIE